MIYWYYNHPSSPAAKQVLDEMTDPGYSIVTLECWGERQEERARGRDG